MMMFNVRKRVFDLNRHKGTKKSKKIAKKFGCKENLHTFAIPNDKNLI